MTTVGDGSAVPLGNVGHHNFLARTPAREQDNIHMFNLIVAHMNEKEKRKFEIHPTFSDKRRILPRIYCRAEFKKGRMVWMEMDERKAARVWQRVQGEKQEAAAPPSREDLPALMMEQLQLASAYLQLARLSPGKDGAVFVRLSREAKAQAVCLKGLLTLITGQSPAIGIPQSQPSQTDAMLRRCYGQELRLWKAYEGRRGDAEYGPVFDRMAARGREHCITVMELIGGAPRP